MRDEQRAPADPLSDAAVGELALQVYLLPVGSVERASLLARLTRQLAPRDRERVTVALIELELDAEEQRERDEVKRPPGGVSSWDLRRRNS